MKILMLVEFFLPFDRGGSEWSVVYLAEALQKKGHTLYILTPNYGAPETEKKSRYTIFRFPFFKKLTANPRQTITPIWQNNIFYWFMCNYITMKYSLRYDIDVIHIHSKSMFPAILGIKLFLRKPVVVTLRDYYPICPYGLCLNKDRKYMGCNLQYLLKEEVRNYMRLYEPHIGFAYKIFHYISAVNSKLTSKFLKFCLQFSNRIVCISKKQQKIYLQNGLTTEVIYNTNSIKRVQRKTSKNKKIIFIGRLTWGKGIYLFLSALRVFFSKYGHIKVIIIGNGLSSHRIQRNLNTLEKKYIKFKSHVNHRLALTYMKSAALVVIPSVWEEPFGRSALEAIIQGTPVVVTGRGGLPEIVKETEGGIITEPTPLKLAAAIKQGLSQQSHYKSNIKKNWEKIKYTFAQHPITQYELLYENLVKKNI